MHIHGTPPEVFTREMIQTVFGLHNHIIQDPVSNIPMMIPIGRHKNIPPLQTVILPITQAMGRIYSRPDRSWRKVLSAGLSEVCL